MGRKGLSRIVLIVAVLVVGGQLFEALPREVTVRYTLGPDHRSVTEARIGYELEGEELKGVRFRYAKGAPAVVDHVVELPPGRYRVVANLRGPGLSRSTSRVLTVPADGIVRIDLFEGAFAMAHNPSGAGTPR